MKLFPSHIKQFQQCPLRYKLKYEDRLQEPASAELFLGSALHDTLAAFFELPAEERSLEQLEELFRKRWAGRDLPMRERRPIVQARYEAFQGDRELEREVGLRGLELIEKFFNTPKLQIQPFMTEEFLELPLVIPGETELQWQYDEELILAGKVDRVDTRPDGTLHIVDYKTGKYVPEDAESLRELEAACLPLQIYALLVRHEYKKPVSRASFFYLEEARFIDIALDNNKLQETKEVVLATAKEIKATAEFEPNAIGNPFCPCSFQDRCPMEFDEVPF